MKTKQTILNTVIVLLLAVPVLAQVTNTNNTAAATETNLSGSFNPSVVGTNLRGSVMTSTNRWRFPLLTRIPGDTNRALGKGRMWTNGWVSTDAAGRKTTNATPQP